MSAPVLTKEQRDRLDELHNVYANRDGAGAARTADDIWTALAYIDTLTAERDAALAEVARMRPVVEMALERRAIHLAAGDDEAEQERRGLLHAEVAEDLAVDAYRTEVQP